MFATTHHRLMTAALGLSLALGTFGCGGAVDEDGDLIGEAASALMAEEESGEISPDGIVDADVDATADEAVANAGESAAPEPQLCDFAARRASVLAQYDADGDGQLGDTEREELRQDLEDMVGTRRARLLTRERHRAFQRVRWAFDENGDNALDETERAAMVAAMEARCERRRQAVLAQFDADADGQLSQTERDAFKAEVRARFQARRAALLAEYDANGDNRLGEAELRQLRADKVAAFQARRQAVLAQYDTDGNGRLSVEEALPLRQEMQRRIAESRDAEPE